MIKLLQCVRKRPELSVLEFRKAWEAHGERLSAMAPAVGAERVVLSTALEVGPGRRIAEERGTLAGFDGVAEIWWTRGLEVLEAAEREGVRKLIEEGRAEQARFIDVSTSCVFFVQDQVVFEQERAGT
jgi:hypothetical protein